MTAELKPLRTRLDAARKNTKIELRVFEIDYLISFVLSGMMSVDALRTHLVFKGGTALRKCYFGDYRFSEDLDFSSYSGVPTKDAMHDAVGEACKHAQKLLQEYGPFEVTHERAKEKAPHPFGQECFIIRGKFPWQTTSPTWTRLKLEISVDEPIMRTPSNCQLIHKYEEAFDVEVPSYCLEEILAEKLRSLLQWAGKLEEKGYAKPRARDYYDLHNILNHYADTLDLSDFRSLLTGKCESKKVRFDGTDSFFQEKVLAEAKKNWETSLNHLVAGLPDFDEVVIQLKVKVEKLIT
jgi:predicted nucleotidyltransferase component of viral defense system